MGAIFLSIWCKLLSIFWHVEVRENYVPVIMVASWTEGWLSRWQRQPGPESDRSTTGPAMLPCIQNKLRPLVQHGLEFHYVIFLYKACGKKYFIRKIGCVCFIFADYQRSCFILYVLTFTPIDLIWPIILGLWTMNQLFVPKIVLLALLSYEIVAFVSFGQLVFCQLFLSTVLVSCFGQLFKVD